MDFTVKGGREGARIAIEEQREKDGILYFDVHMEQEEAIPEPFTASEWIP